MAVGSVAVGLAGCLGSDSGAGPTTGSPSARTSAETDDPPSRGTNTCDEQPITPDVEVRNDRDTAVTVALTVTDRTADAVLFESTYDVPPGGRVTEDERLFTSLVRQTDHDVWAEATVGETTEDADVSIVAQTPLMYGIGVAATDDGVDVYDYHADPGPDVNWDCYPRD